MSNRIRTWLGRGVSADADTTERAAETAPYRSSWVLSVKPPMGPRPQVDGGVYEWTLTAIEPGDERSCRISGIWFWVSCRRTLEARDTVEGASRMKALTRTELCALIEDHRVPESAVHVQRRIDGVRRTDRFAGAADEGFLATLEWGGISE